MLTAWSVFVPVPKAKSVIINLPNVRSLMKKLDELVTFRAAQIPLSVMQSKYNPMINQSMNTAAPYTLNDIPIIRALEKLGISYTHMPMARNGDRYITVGTCRYCPVNAR